jgi:hypothetical protein
MASGKTLRRFLDIFKGDSKSDSANNGVLSSNETLTNKRLLEELSLHFRSMMEAESVGNRMLYPMSFNILMDNEDYENRKQSLPFVLPEVVAEFYKIIDEMRETYPNYTPPAKYWFFQFSACKLGAIETNDSTPLIVRKGHITTVASLLAFDIKEASNISVENSTRVSMKMDDSNVMNDVNVNWNAIKSLDILGEGTFTYAFDTTLNRDTQHISETSKVADTNGIADLSYSRNGRNYHFIMKDNLIHISGKNEKRKGRAFFILESQDIINSHVQIRFTPAENKFQIAAFGPTRLNSSLLNESKGGSIYWYDLANNSSIFINNEISVKFEVK